MKSSKLPFLFVFIIFVAFPFFSYTFEQQEKHEKKKKEEKPVKITEEIQVVGKAPRAMPVSTVTSLDSQKIETLKPLDLSEAIKYAPGVSVTFGDKLVYTLKLRGMDSKRIALLLDGIPVYEPYFSSFDLKTVAAGGIDSLQLTKGPSSVLYGPNTLGGIVNVITRRPAVNPVLSFNASYGEKNTRSIGFDSTFPLNRSSFAGTFLYQDSDGFYFPGEKNGRVKRASSDYQRINLNTKLYFTPSSNTEILFNSGIYLSKYSMPPGLSTDKPRYWRFKNWDRYSFNAGGYTAISQNSTLRFRTYYVQYNNTLDQFNDKEMTMRRFESTYDNSVYGVFALADFHMTDAQSLKLSVNYKKDKARTQDDVDEPWKEYDQDTFSIGIEDHFSFSEKWKLIGGLSLDYLDKFLGENSTKVNPLIGIKFSPVEHLDMHLSFSKKSKFPSMRSMYSSSSGNQDLLSESGQNWEIGFTYNKNIFVTGSIFLTRFKDMIDTLRLPDNSKRFFNINKAYINGFEMQAQKSLKGASVTINYTYLNHKNESDDRPLDALPNHNLNFDFNIIPFSQFRIGFLGIWASSSSWFDYGPKELLDISPYFNLDIILSYHIKQVELFMKSTNIFDHYFYTEPGFPWRGRYLEIGMKMNVLK